MTGRVRTYEAIIKGHNVPKPGVPESFKVLIKELQSLCLDIRVLDAQGDEIELKDDEDDGYQPSNRDFDDYSGYNNGGDVEGEFSQVGGFAVGEMNEEGSVDEAPVFEETGDLYIDGDEE